MLNSSPAAKPVSVLLLAALLALSQVAFAQTDRGTITGTISDPTGAVVPNAAISIKNVATGAEYPTVSTGTGNYTVPALPVGRYNLSASAAGFNQYIQEGITVQVAQTARVDVVLKVGSTGDSVTVQADAPLLRTESAEQSRTVDGDTINQLPLTLGGNNLYGTRNPLAALDLAPGVNNTVGTNFVFRANGTTNAARFMLDGQDITTLGMTSAHLSESHPSTEALQEVTLQISNFAAEFGQVQGGLVNFTTRSGTNAIHGGGYDYFMNEALNAGRPFTNDGKGHLIRPRQRNNNYGFTLGGPVYIPKLYDGRNKTFFFFTFDQFRNKATVSGAATTVPTEAYRRGDFSAALTGRQLGTDALGRPILENTVYDPASERTVDGRIVRDPFQNNVVPTTRLDPVALKMQALIPSPSNSGLVNNLAIVDQTASTTTLPSIKIDQLASSKAKVSFYYADWRNTVPKSTGDGLPFPVSNSREFITSSKTLRFNLDYSLTPTTLLHAGLGEIRYDHIDSNPATTRDFDAPGKLGLKGGLTSPTGFPSVSGLSSSFGGIGNTMGWTSGVHDYDDKPTFNTNVTIIRGNHSIKTGVEWWKDIWTWQQFNTSGSYAFNAAETGLPYLQSTSIGGGSIGFPYASFLLGKVNNSSIRNVLQPQMRKWATSMYVQDTWKITRKMSLDYGVRYDYQTGWYEVHHRSSRFAPWLANPAAGGLLGATQYERDGSFTQAYRYGFGPRLGLAYQIDNKTVLRAGWGLVYGQTPALNYITTATYGAGFNVLEFSNSNYGQGVSLLQNGLNYDVAKLFEASYDPGIRPQVGTTNNPPAWLDDTGGRPPRINQWNISLQRQVLKDLAVDIAYVGNRTAWTQGNNTVSLNASSPEMLAKKGFDITNAADRAVLTSLWNSPAAQARGIKAPYAGFPTGLTVAQALRQFPQFGTSAAPNITTRWAMRGHAWYDSMQVKVTKRYSHNLTAISSFTWQKELEYGLSTPNNYYNKAVNKTISSASQPLVLSLGISYRVPAVGSNRVLRTVIRDWTIGSFFKYASGTPILAPIAQNNLNLLLFGGSSATQAGTTSGSNASGTFMNRVPGQPLFLKNLNCHCIDPNKEFVLNPAAWSSPADGTFGTAAAYYNDYRFQRHPSEQIGGGRLFRIREGMTLEVRVEFFNVFNRLPMADPTYSNAIATQARNSAGVPISGFGYINSQSAGNASVLDNRTDLGGNPRQGQLLMRFSF
jgi:hypothetical protein